MISTLNRGATSAFESSMFSVFALLCAAIFEEAVDIADRNADQLAELKRTNLNLTQLLVRKQQRIDGLRCKIRTLQARNVALKKQLGRTAERTALRSPDNQVRSVQKRKEQAVGYDDS